METAADAELKLKYKYLPGLNDDELYHYGNTDDPITVKTCYRVKKIVKVFPYTENGSKNYRVYGDVTKYTSVKVIKRTQGNILKGVVYGEKEDMYTYGIGDDDTTSFYVPKGIQ